MQEQTNLNAQQHPNHYSNLSDILTSALVDLVSRSKISKSPIFRRFSLTKKYRLIDSIVRNEIKNLQKGFPGFEPEELKILLKQSDYISKLTDALRDVSYKNSWAYKKTLKV